MLVWVVVGRGEGLGGPFGRLEAAASEWAMVVVSVCVVAGWLCECDKMLLLRLDA